MAVDALEGLGIEGVSVDLTVPRLIPAVLTEYDIGGACAQDIRAALDRKDPAAVAADAGPATEVLTALLAATGVAEKALDAMAAIELPDSAARERSRIADVVRLLQAAVPDIRITLDPVENRGFEYHTGIGFTIFARGVSAELASGGRYRVPNGSDGSGTDSGSGGERATGVTLYVDTILGIVRRSVSERRIWLPAGTSPADAAALRGDGWMTVSALEDTSSPKEAARQLACSHVLGDGGPEPV